MPSDYQDFTNQIEARLNFFIDEKELDESYKKIESFINKVKNNYSTDVYKKTENYSFLDNISKFVFSSVKTSPIINSLSNIFGKNNNIDIVRSSEIVRTIEKSNDVLRDLISEETIEEFEEDIPSVDVLSVDEDSTDNVLEGITEEIMDDSSDVDLPDIDLPEIKNPDIKLPSIPSPVGYNTPSVPEVVPASSSNISENYYPTFNPETDEFDYENIDREYNIPETDEYKPILPENIPDNYKTNYIQPEYLPTPKMYNVDKYNPITSYNMSDSLLNTIDEWNYKVPDLFKNIIISWNKLKDEFINRLEDMGDKSIENSIFNFIEIFKDRIKYVGEIVIGSISKAVDFVGSVFSGDSSKVSDIAKELEGKQYWEDSCGFFTNEFLKKMGVDVTKEGVGNIEWAPDYAKGGKAVKGWKDAKPGDVIVFKDNASVDPYPHVGIIIDPSTHTIMDVSTDAGYKSVIRKAEDLTTSMGWSYEIRSYFEEDEDDKKDKINIFDQKYKDISNISSGNLSKDFTIENNKITIPKIPEERLETIPELPSRKNIPDVSPTFINEENNKEEIFPGVYITNKGMDLDPVEYEGYKVIIHDNKDTRDVDIYETFNDDDNNNDKFYEKIKLIKDSNKWKVKNRTKKKKVSIINLKDSYINKEDFVKDIGLIARRNQESIFSNMG